MKIIAATSNAGKIKEIKKIFSSPDIEIISMKDAGIDIDVEETGETFEENALIKARAISKLSSCAVLSDDSGLCVDALGGAPGVYSARYAGDNASDDEKIDLLLKNMKDKKDRSAKFVSVVAFISVNGEEITSKGEVCGQITEEKSGTGGFGYDPVFYSDELKKTFGTASQDEKNSISHRARALDGLHKKLKERGIL